MVKKDEKQAAKQKATKEKAAQKAKAEAEARAEAEEKVRAEIAAEAKAKAEAKARAEAEAEAEAKPKKSKNLRVFDAEKAKARKSEIKARIGSRSSSVTREQRQHYLSELKAIEKKIWFAPYTDEGGNRVVWKLPAKATAIDQFLNS